MRKFKIFLTAMFAVFFLFSLTFNIASNQKGYTASEKSELKWNGDIAASTFLTIPDNDGYEDITTLDQNFAGSGTVGSPYIIYTAQELALLASLVNSGTEPYSNTGVYYKLGADISLNNYGSNFNGGKGWASIGSYYGPFNGNFDGAGHKITNLYMSNPDSSFGGLFGNVNDSTIKNLHIENANIIAYNYVGGIAGSIYGDINNCSFTGTISAAGGIAGGIAGFIGGDISNCYSTVNISGGNTSIGGIAGDLSCGNITNCYSTGNISGEFTVGGIAGLNWGYVTNCYSACTVSGIDDVGGIVGISRGNVVDCVAVNPKVSSQNHAGRIGTLTGGGTLNYTYARSDMKDIYDSSTSWFNIGQENLDGQDITLQTAYTAAFYTNESNWGGVWDTDIWIIKDGYLPYFKGSNEFISLTLNNPATVTITSGARLEVRFIAPADGIYEFESSNRGTLDPKAYVNLTGSSAYDDDSAGNLNYRFQRTLTAGQIFTYYSGVYNDYTTSNGSYTVNVVKIKANGSVSVSIIGWTYGDASNSPVPLIITGDYTNPSFQYKVQGAADSTYDATVPTTAGNYTVKVSYAATDNYNVATATYNFTISKASRSHTVSLTGWTYGQAANNPSVSGTVAESAAVTYYYDTSSTGSFTLTTKPTNAGTYYVKAHIAETANYNALTTAAVSFTITKANGAVSVSMTGWTVGQTASNPTSTITIGDYTNPTYQYKVQGTADSTYTSTKPSTAGNYTVRVTYAATANYNEVTATANFTIFNTAYILTLNNPIFITITSGDRREVIFTAPSAGTYVFESTNRNGLDPKAYINLTGSSAYDDDSGSDIRNYKFQQMLTAGQTFIFYSGVYNDTASSNGSYTVSVVKIKADGSVSVGITGWTYGQSPNNPVPAITTGDYTNPTYQYKEQNADDTAYTATAPTTAGNYTVRANFAATANYNEATATANFTISKANRSHTVSLTGWTYGQTANNPSVLGTVAESAAVTFYYDTSASGSFTSTTKPTNAGTYYVKAQIAESANYNALTTAAAQFTISKANGEVSVNMAGWIVGQTASNPVPTIITGDYTNPTYHYKIQGANDSTYSTTKPSVVGNYTVRLTYSVTANYNEATATANFSISNKATRTGDSVTMADWTYNGTASNPIPSFGPAGSTTVTYQYQGTASTVYPLSGTKPTNAGTYKVIATFAETAGYSSATAEANFTILKANGAIVTASLTGWTYGNAANNPSVSGNPSTEQTIPSYEYQFNQTGSWTTTKPTTSGTHNVRAVFTASANYNALTTAAATFTILKANRSHMASLSGWTYGQAANNPSVLGTVAESAVVTYYYDTSATGTFISTTKPTNAGTYYVKAYIAETTNYNALTTEAVSFTIAKANGAVSVSITGWTVGQTASNPTSTITTGDYTNPTYQYKVQGSEDSTYISTKPTTAGNYTVRVTYAATANYNEVTATANFTISNKAAGTGSVTMESWMYNTTASIPLISYGTAGVRGVTYLYQGTGSTSYNTATRPVNAGTYKLTVTFEETSTHLSSTAEANFTISKANRSHTVSLMGWLYGQEANNPSISGTVAENAAVTYFYDISIAGQFLSTTKPTTAGTYYVKAYVAASANYNEQWTNAASFIITLVKLMRDNTLTINGWVYGKIANEPYVGTVAEGAFVTYYYDTSLSGAFLSTIKPSLPGIYFVKAYIAESNTYLGLETNIVQFTISKASYNMNGVKFEDKVVKYDGNSHSIEVTGLPKGLEAEYINNGKTEKGTYTITVRFKSTDENYVAPPDMMATLIINETGTMSYVGQNNTDDGGFGYLIWLPIGFGATLILSIMLLIIGKRNSKRNKAKRDLVLQKVDSYGVSYNMSANDTNRRQR